MNPSIRDKLKARRAELDVVCRKYGVTSLDLFGSGLSDSWHPDRSDLDFLVTFRSVPGGGIGDRYLGLAEDLEAPFGRKVDIITPGAIRNPYFRRAVDATRTRFMSSDPGKPSAMLVDSKIVPE